MVESREKSVMGSSTAHLSLEKGFLGCCCVVLCCVMLHHPLCLQTVFKPSDGLSKLSGRLQNHQAGFQGLKPSGKP